MVLMSHFVKLGLNFLCLNTFLSFLYTGEVSFLSQEDKQWFKRLQLQAKKTFMTDRTKISTPSDHSAK